ncbi:MAG: (d)CMP kinase [Coriobacteriia bacterium]|nr:(d)CMP kinase [Coriobacteriia bacterium]
MIIAIDGPAGSGKSTIAKLVAARLGFTYLDTGAMYRAVAWRALENDVDMTEPLSEASLKALGVIASEEEIRFVRRPGETQASQVFINDRDVSAEIRTPTVDKAVSPVSAQEVVRAALVKQQRKIGLACDTVMEGRDIGTVVFPEAELKVFLTACPEERAQRRTIQNASRQGLFFDEDVYEQTLASIISRDAYDSTRPTSPLKAAADSIEIDSTGMAIETVVKYVIDLVEDIRGMPAEQ